MIGNLLLHRCGKCLTKTYCSRECQRNDWEVKHQEFCKETPEERKVKIGAKDRVETGLEKFEDQFQHVMKSCGKDPEELQTVLEAKEICERKGSANKAEKGGVKSKVQEE